MQWWAKSTITLLTVVSLTSAKTSIDNYYASIGQLHPITALIAKYIKDPEQQRRERIDSIRRQNRARIIRLHRLNGFFNRTVDF